MSENSPYKPSFWFGLVIMTALVAVLIYFGNSQPPVKIGAVWLNPVEGGFTVSFQLHTFTGEMVPGRGFADVRFSQILYPTSDETGATVYQHFSFNENDFQSRTIREDNRQIKTYTATTPKITYQNFIPRTQRGVICKMIFTFADNTEYRKTRYLRVVKNLEI